jgi:hypothetical protein
MPVLTGDLFLCCHPERQVWSLWRPDEESKDPYPA